MEKMYLMLHVKTTIPFSSSCNTRRGADWHSLKFKNPSGDTEIYDAVYKGPSIHPKVTTLHRHCCTQCV